MKDAGPWVDLLKDAPRLVTMSLAQHGTHVSRESFLLPDLWALHFYEYEGSLEVEDVVYSLHPGCVTLVPPGARVFYRYKGHSQHIYSHFRMGQELANTQYSPVFFAADSRLIPLKHLMHEALGFRQVEPLRATARLWDVLLGLASLERTRYERASHDSILQTATHFVHQAMGAALSVDELARHCEISHNQFTRIVKKQTGMTPQVWLRTMRMERAHELLRYSDVPIKVIAHEVGFPDLQHFNKTVRCHFGVSPSKLREFFHST